LITSSAFSQEVLYIEKAADNNYNEARSETINGTYPAIKEGDLVINEILASNDSGNSDEEDEFEDWVELYNTTSTTLSLDDLYLSDDIDDRLIYQFPAGTTLAADSYLIVWCDKDEEQGDFHAGFKLSAGGESVILSHLDGTILQEINFDEQTTDMSYARNPNGTGDFVITTPTFGSNNETTLSINRLEPYLKIRFYPNPIQTSLTVESSEYLIKSLKVSSLLGQVLFNKETINQTKTEIDFSNFSKGIYFVTINNSEVLKVIKQ
jgi:hypothetical protein